MARMSGETEWSTWHTVGSWGHVKGGYTTHLSKHNQIGEIEHAKKRPENGASQPGAHRQGAQHILLPHVKDSPSFILCPETRRLPGGGDLRTV